MTSYGIVAITTGTDPTDWLGTDGIDKVELTTKYPIPGALITYPWPTDTQLEVPLIQENFRFFNFRL